MYGHVNHYFHGQIKIMASRKLKRGRPLVYTAGRKEFKLCMPLALFAKVQQAAQTNGGADVSAQIRKYIERGLEAEKERAA